MSNAEYDMLTFCKEVIESAKVWTIKDDAGIPVPEGDGGHKTMPFWSSAAKAQDIVDKAKAYAGFTVLEIELSTFTDKWLPGIDQDELLVGINWCGEHALGADIEPDNLKEAIEYQLGQ